MYDTERIAEMEQLFDDCTEAVAGLSEAIEKYRGKLGDIGTLIRYYDGGEWREDFEADESGLLAPGLKRGVLSEDGLYDLLSENRELTLRMLGLLTEIAERGTR